MGCTAGRPPRCRATGVRAPAPAGTGSTAAARAGRSTCYQAACVLVHVRRQVGASVVATDTWRPRHLPTTPRAPTLGPRPRLPDPRGALSPAPGPGWGVGVTRVDRYSGRGCPCRRESRSGARGLWESRSSSHGKQRAGHSRWSLGAAPGAPSLGQWRELRRRGTFRAYILCLPQ